MKILVVDDSFTMRRIIVRILSGLGHDEVVQAEDGIEAITKIESEDVDFVLTDWNMPNMSGLELVMKLRADDRYQKLPIVMVTTEAEKANVIEAIKKGVNNYVVKPFTPEILKEKIEVTLEKCRQ